MRAKFKKGDWVREDDAEPGDEMHVHGYRIYDVLPNDQYVLEMNESDFRVTSESQLCDCVVEPRCTGWDWVLPEPLIDGPGKYMNRTGKIVEIIRKVSSNLFPEHCWEDKANMLYRPDGTYRVNPVSDGRDIMAKYVEQPTTNRFGLKVGDKVRLEAHDRRFWDSAKEGKEFIITSIDDSYRDGIARFNLDGEVKGTWHPYWFGLCQSDGSPLPEKPATKLIVLEEWCTGVSEAASAVTFVWRKSTSLSPIPAYWTRTGKTRELEVPDVE